MTKTPEQMYYEWRQMWDESTDKNVCASRPIISPTTDLGMLVFLAGYQAAKDQLADADNVMNSPEKPDSWISVKDRLPEDGDEVIVVSNGKPCASWHEAGDFGWAVGGKVTHWMPLPEAPKGEG